MDTSCSCRSLETRAPQGPGACHFTCDNALGGLRAPDARAKLLSSSEAQITPPLDNGLRTVISGPCVCDLPKHGCHLIIRCISPSNSAQTGQDRRNSLKPIAAPISSHATNPSFSNIAFPFPPTSPSLSPHHPLISSDPTSDPQPGRTLVSVILHASGCRYPLAPRPSAAEIQPVRPQSRILRGYPSVKPGL